MNAGELRQLLTRVPDETPVFLEGRPEGACHIETITKERRWQGRPASIILNGRTNWSFPAPPTAVRGRWPAEPPAPPRPFNINKAVAELVAILQESP